MVKFEKKNLWFWCAIAQKIRKKSLIPKLVQFQRCDENSRFQPLSALKANFLFFFKKKFSKWSELESEKKFESEKKSWFQIWFPNLFRPKLWIFYKKSKISTSGLSLRGGRGGPRPPYWPPIDDFSKVVGNFMKWRHFLEFFDFDQNDFFLYKKIWKIFKSTLNDGISEKITWI